MTGLGQLSFNLEITHLLALAEKEYKPGFFPVLPRVNKFLPAMSSLSLLQSSMKITVTPKLAP